MSINELERRLIAIEQEVAQLKAQRALVAHPITALERIHGTFENDSAFREAMQLGRKWRKSDRKSPTVRKPKARRK